jgi:alpha-galactosidase
MARELRRVMAGAHVATFLHDSDIPRLVHLGHEHAAPVTDDLIDHLIPPAGLDRPAAPSLVTNPATGWFGEPGVVLTRNGKALTINFGFSSEKVSGEAITLDFTDDDLQASLRISAQLHESGVLTLQATVTNLGNQDLGVHALALTLPVPQHLDELLLHGGRHAMEFVEERIRWGRSVVTSSSRRGRTSHQQSPSVICMERSTTESRGEAWGVHFAWSGNFQLTCDAVTADLRTITAQELLAPGEVTLGENESYSTPPFLVTRSSEGLSGVSNAFHQHLRANSPPSKRSVIVNTWEVVYFQHDNEKIFELARRAARVGAERFVLDDGWFRGRRDDTAGLGDWEVDPDVWPNGLEPLAELVTSLGMQFGLWFEPEMINPNSNLYREHPDWVLGEARQHHLTGRHQLVLDLSRREVREHLFTSIDRLLARLPISHVKWDHNRDLVAPGAHQQTLGTYELISRLRKAHPHVEFESCASGGGRIDAGMAHHVTRFWTSDSIDALDRLEIQRGAMRFIPPEMLGAHIGAPVCHTTGRRHSLSFRALSALPFWLGVEWDLLSASEHDLDRLSEVITVHKRFRQLVHTGVTRFGNHPDHLIHQHAIIAKDRAEALLIVASRGSGPRHETAPIRVEGLDAANNYRCALVPLGKPTWALHRGLPRWVEHGVIATGSQLADVGLPMPPLLPASGILVHMERVQ